VITGKNLTLAGSMKNSGIPKTDAPIGGARLAANRQRRGSSFSWLRGN